MLQDLALILWSITQVIGLSDSLAHFLFLYGAVNICMLLLWSLVWLQVAIESWFCGAPVRLRLSELVGAICRSLLVFDALLWLPCWSLTLVANNFDMLVPRLACVFAKWKGMCCLARARMSASYCCSQCLAVMSLLAVRFEHRCLEWLLNHVLWWRFIPWIYFKALHPRLELLKGTCLFSWRLFTRSVLISHNKIRVAFSLEDFNLRILDSSAIVLVCLLSLKGRLRHAWSQGIIEFIWNASTLYPELWMHIVVVRRVDDISIL